MMNEAMIRAVDVHKHFGPVEVLKGVSLEVGKGEVIAIIGPSGSGKSTFLRCLIHLETVHRGTIEIEGKNWLRPTPPGTANTCRRPRSAASAARWAWSSSTSTCFRT